MPATPSRQELFPRHKVLSLADYFFRRPEPNLPRSRIMATQYTQLLMEDGVDFFPADVSENERTYPETMEEYDTFELDEQDLVLAQEAARQQFNKTEVRPNMYSFDWSDAHGALWDRVKQKIVSETACI